MIGQFNPLTTDDAVWCHLTLGACYQLAIRFEDGFCASKEGRIGGGGWAYSRHAVHMAGLPWLAVEWPWLALAGPFLTLLALTGVETTPLALKETISGIVGQFQ